MLPGSDPKPAADVALDPWTGAMSPDKPLFSKVCGMPYCRMSHSHRLLQLIKKGDITKFKCRQGFLKQPSLLKKAKMQAYTTCLKYNTYYNMANTFFNYIYIYFP